MQEPMYVHATLDSKGIVDKIIDSDKMHVEGAYLIRNYYSVDVEPTLCRISGPIEDDEGVKWYNLIIDEEALEEHIKEQQTVYEKEQREADEARKELEALQIIQKALLKSDEVVLQASSNVSDEDAPLLEDKIPLWQEGKKYTLNQIVKYNVSLYRVTQQEVTAQGHQQPGSTGMSAVYRPIGKDLPTEESGTMENPIPFVYEMDVDKGKYYSYQDKVYLAKADMKPCVWHPGTAGLWQWELVK